MTLILMGVGLNVSNFKKNYFSHSKLGVFRGVYVEESKLLDTPVNFEIWQYFTMHKKFTKNILFLLFPQINMG